MTNKQILEKAIEKAVKNGFKYVPYQVSDGVHPTIIEIPEINIYGHLIFSHSFAKHFWGEEEEWIRWRFGTETGGMAKWCYHLTQMVLKEKPLLYLKKFL